jgi:Leucine-rich repeat (LRR) protein
MVYVAQLPELNSLEIGGAGVTGEGIKLLSPLTKLHSLHLTELDIKAEDLQVLPTSIDDLSLPYCNVGDEVVEVLQRFKGLTKLDLQGTLLTEAGIEALASLPQLTTLDLSDLSIRTEGLRALKKLPMLQSLVLTGIKLNEQKVIALSELEHLRELDLSDSDLNDEGLQHFVSMTKLKVLYLADTPTSEAAINRLHRSRGDLTIYVGLEIP